MPSSPSRPLPSGQSGSSPKETLLSSDYHLHSPIVTTSAESSIAEPAPILDPLPIRRGPTKHDMPAVWANLPQLGDRSFSAHEVIDIVQAAQEVLIGDQNACIVDLLRDDHRDDRAERRIVRYVRLQLEDTASAILTVLRRSLDTLETPNGESMNADELPTEAGQSVQSDLDPCISPSEVSHSMMSPLTDVLYTIRTASHLRAQMRPHVPTSPSTPSPPQRIGFTSRPTTMARRILGTKTGRLLLAGERGVLSEATPKESNIAGRIPHLVASEQGPRRAIGEPADTPLTRLYKEHDLGADHEDSCASAPSGVTQPLAPRKLMAMTHSRYMPSPLRETILPISTQPGFSDVPHGSRVHTDLRPSDRNDPAYYKHIQPLTGFPEPSLSSEEQGSQDEEIPSPADRAPESIAGSGTLPTQGSSPEERLDPIAVLAPTSTRPDRDGRSDEAQEAEDVHSTSVPSLEGPAVASHQPALLSTSQTSTQTGFGIMDRSRPVSRGELTLARPLRSQGHNDRAQSFYSESRLIACGNKEVPNTPPKTGFIPPSPFKIDVNSMSSFKRR
ncbi:hypothetical protein IAU59_007582 [Kwoniella sp. CBS 9459]